MTTATEQIYNDAILLNPIDRAELIEKLYNSFTTNNKDIEIELKWKEEIDRRIQAYDNGDISSDSMENVFKRLSKR